MKSYKYRIRVGDDPAPLADPTTPAGEQPKKEKLDKKVVLEKLQNSGSLLAYAFSIGLAMALSSIGIQTKEDLKGLQPTDLASSLNGLLKLVLSSRNELTRELRIVWRFGPKKYLQRKGTELRSL